MGRHSTRTLYVIFAACMFVAVAAVTAAVTLVQYDGVRDQAERDASEATAAALAPSFASLEATDSAAFSATAVAFVNEHTTALRLWSPDGDLLASEGADASDTTPVLTNTAGETSRQRVDSPQGAVLATFAGLPSGATLEIQQPYAMVASSIATTRQQLILFAIIGGAAVLVLLQAVFWGVTRGIRSEYDRLAYLYRSGQAIRSTLDLTNVLEQVTRDCAVHTSAQAGLATVLEDESDELILKASYITATETTAQHHKMVEEWFIRRCAATGEAVSTNEESFHYERTLGHELQPQGPVSILCVAIPGRERPIGVITLVRAASRGAYHANEVHMIKEIAAQAGMAVEQATLFTKVRAYAEEVEIGYDGTLRALMAALDTKDSATQGHSKRVARLTTALAREMDLPPERMADIERGALLHDVGKIGVPDSVLQKPGPLDEREWTAMQKHPLLAGLMISNISFLEGATPILLYHHERYDGGGYPFALEGEAIPLEARIFAVIDAFDAMTFDRPYREAQPTETALREIRANSGTQFDPEVVEAFARMIRRMPQSELLAA